MHVEGGKHSRRDKCLKQIELKLQQETPLCFTWHAAANVSQAMGRRRVMVTCVCACVCVRVCVLCNTLTASDWSRQNQTGKEKDRLCDFLTPRTRFLLTLHVIIPEERLQKGQTENFTWKFNNQPYAVGCLVYIVAPCSAKLVTLLVSVLSRRCEAFLCWRRWTALIDRLSRFLTETRKKF